jgi:hypothetical protein
MVLIYWLVAGFYCISNENNFAIGYPNDYRAGFHRQLPSKKIAKYTRVFELEPFFAAAYTSTKLTGEIINRLAYAVSSYEYDESIQNLDTFGIHYYQVFACNPDPNVRDYYENFLKTAYERLRRFYCLIGKENNNLVPKPKNVITDFRIGRFDPCLDPLLDTLIWELGTLSQLKVVMDSFFRNPQYPSMVTQLKNRFSPIHIPLVCGKDYLKEPMEGEKKDVL